MIDHVAEYVDQVLAEDRPVSMPELVHLAELLVEHIEELGRSVTDAHDQMAWVVALISERVA